MTQIVKATGDETTQPDLGPDFETVPQESEPGKSAGKSAPGRPYEAGDDPRRGSGPVPGAPNAGRPPSAVREAMRLSAAQRVSVLEEIADDAKAADRDRIRAVDTLAKYGLGQMVQVAMDDVRGRLRDTLEVLRQTLPANEFTALLPRLKEIWT